MTRTCVFQVALSTPVMRLFDYLPPVDGDGRGYRGQRILIPFGKSTRVGVIVAVKQSSDIPVQRLRHATRIIDDAPLLDENVMALLEWASNYYHYPPGEVFTAALPAILRRGGALITHEPGWQITTAGSETDQALLDKRAPVQGKILSLLKDKCGPAGKAELAKCGANWRQSLHALEKKGWLEPVEIELIAQHVRQEKADQPPELTQDQREAVNAITAENTFVVFLLQGITGSGKTEVYLRCIERQLASGRQSLVLVPEIGLTPQLVDRFRRRFDTPVVVMHSGLNDSQRLSAWAAARDGSAGVIIGTRSAVFVPLANPGLIIVDEEHDASLKQQEGFRYSARDLAVWRSSQLDVPIIMGSATPSFESLENINAGRYRRLVLRHRPGNARQPDIRLIDLRVQPTKDGLTEPLRQAISRHLEDDGQVLVYLNRRGYAPILMCTACGEIEQCRRCDARMVLHQQRAKLICHHCGAEKLIPPACGSCGTELLAVGQGTQRLENALQELYPGYGIVRIDRDTTRRRGEIQRRLEQVRSGQAQLLLGTQMLTKGHDFPRVTMVAIIDADQGLFGTDFRSSERLAQSFIQVAGRAGRGERPGEVYIQTLFPDNPLLTTLVTGGYGPFAAQAMQERSRAGWPPYTYLTLLRAESTQRPPAFAFLDEARDLAWTLVRKRSGRHIRILGPAPAPMERRSGRYRGQLLVQADSRAQMQRFVATWREQLESLKTSRRARWSLDVDPIELF
ncbi:MAG: primosomal protein N' [Gammaproteobacteria bacterium]|nr:primosomal protein N' [Gammaproteobacteria bacterium]